jgi:nitrate/TMAO reductase-like tetraheme cytochrome c subunit
LSPKEVAAAKKLYTSKCAKCHKFYDPAGYNQSEWDEWMQKMRKKSKLKPDQYALLSRYLETLRGSEKMPEK